MIGCGAGVVVGVHDVRMRGQLGDGQGVEGLAAARVEHLVVAVQVRNGLEAIGGGPAAHRIHADHRHALEVGQLQRLERIPVALGGRAATRLEIGKAPLRRSWPHSQKYRFLVSSLARLAVEPALPIV